MCLLGMEQGVVVLFGVKGVGDVLPGRGAGVGDVLAGHGAGCCRVFWCQGRR